MPVALDRARYFAARLSDNIAETPEGYRLCRNAIIARTGFQTYKVSEIADPEGLLADREPGEEIELWRDAEEVFSPATLASFEGKTFTLTHPEDLLDPDTERDHHEGHVQNVRRGSEPLDTGDLPVLADILVTGRDAIRAIDAGFRELSCGYAYRLAKKGYRYEQQDIRGNHVALVQKGRAGAEARINDAAPEEPINMNIFEKLFGKGFSLAKDAKAADIEAVNRVLALDESHGNTEKKEEIDPLLVKMFKLTTGKDAEMAPATDARKRMHDMLDEMLSAEEEKKKKGEEQKDADLGELKRLMNGFLGEESQELKPAGDAEAHPEGCRCADCMDKAKDGQEHERMERDAAPPEKKEEAEDGEIINAEPVLSAEERPKSVFDAETAKATLGMVNLLKPFIARSKDKKLAAAFDTLTGSLRAMVKKPVEGERGSYVDFGKAANRLSEKAKDAAEWKPRETPGQKDAREADAIYQKHMAEERKNRVRR